MNSYVLHRQYKNMMGIMAQFEDKLQTILLRCLYKALRLIYIGMRNQFSTSEGEMS